MRLGELAFACDIYSRITDYDRSYAELVKATQPQLDLTLDEHLEALLVWLNKWGCRQFAKYYHKDAAEEIREWYEAFRYAFLPAGAALLSLTEQDLALVERAYADLVSKTASFRQLAPGREARVEIGPTGAAKILFALRPDALIPWDDPIRKKLGFGDGSARSYGQYLRIAREHLEQIGCDCRKYGLELAGLPARLGRPQSSLAKLVDEFFWVTITRRYSVPDHAKSELWASWLS